MCKKICFRSSKNYNNYQYLRKENCLVTKDNLGFPTIAMRVSWIFKLP